MSKGHSLDFQVLQIIFQDCLFNLDNALDAYKLLQELSSTYKNQIKLYYKELKRQEEVKNKMGANENLDYRQRLNEVYALIKS